MGNLGEVIRPPHSHSHGAVCYTASTGDHCGHPSCQQIMWENCLACDITGTQEMAREWEAVTDSRPWLWSSEKISALRGAGRDRWLHLAAACVSEAQEIVRAEEPGDYAHALALAALEEIYGEILGHLAYMRIDPRRTILPHMAIAIGEIIEAKSSCDGTCRCAHEDEPGPR